MPWKKNNRLYHLWPVRRSSKCFLGTYYFWAVWNYYFLEFWKLFTSVWKILSEDEGMKLCRIMLGKQVKVIGWSGQTPFHRQEKNQTSKNVHVIPRHLVLCNVASPSMTLMCLFSVTANTVLVNTVRLHQVSYDMIGVWSSCWTSQIMC